jgi:hypothetical protein
MAPLMPWDIAKSLFGHRGVFWNVVLLIGISFVLLALASFLDNVELWSAWAKLFFGVSLVSAVQSHDAYLLSTTHVQINQSPAEPWRYYDDEPQRKRKFTWQGFPWTVVWAVVSLVFLLFAVWCFLAPVEYGV